MSGTPVLQRFSSILALSIVAALSASSAVAASFVYVANAESQDISVFALDAQGALNPLQTQPVGGTVMPMHVAADKQRLYAALRSRPYRVVTLKIDAKSGLLSEQGATPLPDSMANIALDRSGRFLFAASYGGNKLSVSPLDERGVPLPATQIVATGPMAHQVSADPQNRHVYASVLGADQLMRLDFDAQKGVLQPAASPALQLSGGSGPRHFVFAPKLPLIYLLDELDGRLHVLARNADTGETRLLQSLGVVTPALEGKPAAADLHLTPDGQFLYASERTSSSLSGFRVDPASGLLTLIGQWPTETQPRGFNISPDGKYLLAVGQKSHQLSVYRIEAGSGQLSSLGRYATGKGPNWVEIIDLP